MSADSTPDVTAPRDVIMMSLYNADHAFLTRDLADYLALFLVLVLGLFRLDAVIKRLNIGIRMTRDVGCETENDAAESQDILNEEEVSQTAVPSLEDEIYERKFRDFACNTSHIQLIDQESNTERINLPIVLTASPMNRYTESGTNTEAGLLHFSRKTLISECTQTSRTNLNKGRVTTKSKSKIPVLLKKTRLNRNQKAQALIVDLRSSITSSQSIPELLGGTASFYPGSRLSGSSSGWDRRTTPSPTRTITPDVQELSKMLPKSSPKPEVLKKSSTWSDRYRYCDSSIRNDVLLRSPKKKDSASATLERSARWSVVENTPMGSPRLGKSKCVRKCRSFGGEVTEYTENLSPQNFVLNPRLRYPSNRRLYKVTYVAGS